MRKKIEVSWYSAKWKRCRTATRLYQCIAELRLLGLLSETASQKLEKEVLVRSGWTKGKALLEML